MQITTGIRSLLSIPILYKAFQKLMSKIDTRKLLVDEYIKPNKGDFILDIGCGPADMLWVLPENINYIGMDLSDEYIEAAKKKYGDRGQFFKQDINQVKLNGLAHPDIILLIGVMHHLDDHELNNMFVSLKSVMKSTTRLITLDGCYLEKQNYIAKKMLDHDRGKNVRNGEEYLKILKQYFKTTDHDIRHDFSYIPYTYIIFQCSNPI